MPDRIVMPKTDIARKKKAANWYDSEITYFTNEELHLLFQDKHKILWHTLFENAGRISEVLKLTYSDIEKDGSVRITTLKQRKKSKDKEHPKRLIYFTQELQDLIPYKRRNGKYEEGVCIFDENKGYITRQAASQLLKRTCNRIGIPENKAHLHTFRHTMAINLLKGGTNIQVLKNILGHKSIVNTLIYLRFSNQDIKQAIIARQ